MTPQQQNQRQNGVALITAMLVVAMATLIAANLVWDQHLQMRRTESMLAQEQARQYALAAESIGIEILLDDRGDWTRLKDHRGEIRQVGNEATVARGVL